MLQQFSVSVDDIITAKDRAKFEEETQESLFELYQKTEVQAKEISGIKFGYDKLEKKVRQNELDVDNCLNKISDTMLYLELNGKMDVIVSNSIALYIDYMDVLHDLDEWMTLLNKGETPKQLYGEEQLNSMQKILSSMGLKANRKFQESKSTILPDPLHPTGITIVSEIRGTGVPWNIYEIIPIPRWNQDKLFRQNIGHRYIAIDPYFTRYANLDDLTFNKCLDNACELRGPIRTLSNAECGRMELIGQTTDKNDCKWDEISHTQGVYFEG